LNTGRRRDLLLRALEHLVSARRQLERAQKACTDEELLELLAGHLERLETTTRNTERMLHDLDAAG
jgi:hypothetical protein